MIKNILLLFVMAMALLQNGFSQNSALSQADVTGSYRLNNNPDGKQGNTAQWHLELMPDGRFLYHFQRQLMDQDLENFYGKGTYEVKNLLVTFSTENSEIDNDFIINLNGTKARVHKKHARNKSKQRLPVFIHFISSQEAAIKGLKLYKDDA